MSLRPSLGRGLLLRLLSGGGFLLSIGAVIGIVVGIFLLVTKPWVTKEPPVKPVVPGAPKKDQPGQGEVAKNNADKDGRTYPKSPAEIVQERLDNGKKTFEKVTSNVVEEGKRVAVKEDTADYADYWIWIHIKEGNWDSSGYSSGKGFTSFLACVKSSDLHPNIINGDSYTYDFDRNLASPKSASYPEATVRKMGNGDETMLMAVINSEKEKNTHRIAMLEALLDHGADPNLRFGPKAHTALMEAATLGDEDVVKCLLSHGAKRNLKDLDKEAAIDCTQSDSIKALLK
jgi:hypothetical protein